MRSRLLGLALTVAFGGTAAGQAQAQDGWSFNPFEAPKGYKRQQQDAAPARTSQPKARPVLPKAVTPVNAVVKIDQPKPADATAPKDATGNPAAADAATGDPKAQAHPALKPLPVPGASSLWRITRTSWTERDEKGFEEFVARIGESKCRTMHQCLTSAEANPLYRASNPLGMHFYADCADLPYMLRAYYAWKNGLPFSFSSAVTPLGHSNDIRYTARGNKIAARQDVTGGMDARRLLPQMMGAISSAHYRYPPAGTAGLPTDHYPVKIAPESIKPGTIIYDPNGHVAVVYKVTPEGRIHYIDTHPDNSLTRGVYSRAFQRASPDMGAGFKRWRPVTLTGATQGADGTYHGGRIELAANTSLPDWSDEQFYGTGPEKPKTWSAGKFALNGETLDYYDYVRRRLAKAGFKYNPLDETRSMVRALCEDAKYRVDAVDIAIKAGIHKRGQPDRLPGNIYGTEGDWETYSTPSRDARLKTGMKELRDEIARYLELAKSEPEKIDYAGSDLRRDLLGVYQTETASCTFSYVKTDGREQALGFDELVKRLFRLSFDPYHCVERRWGASSPEELATCPDEGEKKAWYEAEERLRNQLARTYDAKMSFSLGELKRAVPGSGVDTPPDVDVRALLAEKVSVQ